jgi:pimeloyl-ACP methyl ester carboxylesterase
MTSILLSAAMITIPSKDGTPIAVFRSGNGPPLVLVHGTTADHARWAPILAKLEERFTVYAVDRRGRGGSGDKEPYAIEREFEDVAAVVNSLKERAFVLGHSYGAICSLEAALRTDRIRKLVLYEPPMGVAAPPGVLDRLQAQLDGGQREQVLLTFFREVVRMPEPELATLRALPNWPARVGAAHTIPRELRNSGAYAFQPERFKGLGTPTLLLLGGDSPPIFSGPIEKVRATLPDARVVVLPGQQHAAINTAPDLFLREVLAFL